MGVAERNSRLLLVVGGVGLSGVLFNIIGNLIRKSYSTIKLGEEIPISVSQLFSSLLLASFIVLLGLALIYCYFELFSYSNLNEEKLGWYFRQADRFYLYLLKFFAISFIAIIIIIILYCFSIELFLIMNKVKILGIGFIITILLIILISFWYIKLREVIVEVVKGVFNTLKSLFNEKFIAITSISLFCWLLCFIFSTAMGVESNTSAKMNIKFDEKNNTISINYEDKVIDYFPKEFKIIIKDDREFVKEIILNSTDFNTSYISVIGELKDSNKEQELLLNKNTFKYSYEVQLNEISNIKEGTIYIQFDKNSFLNKDTYRIANYFEKKEGKYKFDFPEIKLDF